MTPARCPTACSHDLQRGVLTADLLAGDGPFPDRHPLELGRWSAAFHASRRRRPWWRSFGR